MVDQGEDEKGEEKYRRSQNVDPAQIFSLEFSPWRPRAEHVRRYHYMTRVLYFLQSHDF